jgi:hypothetical protein
MKNSAYRARCIEKALNKHSSLDVMLDLADIAFDIFLIRLKEKNKNPRKEDIQRELREMSEWKKNTSKS